MISIDLTVSFDPNGSPAANIVSMDLYVAFTGLTPVGYLLGDIFTPYASDPSFFALNGVCADLFTCMYPDGTPDSPTTYQAFASVPTPHAPTGPGHALHHAVRRLARRVGVVAERLRRSGFRSAVGSDAR